MPADDKKSSDELLCLLGQQLIHRQQQCEIIEVLDNTELVLQVLRHDTHIQATQYGEGHRAVPVTYILPIFDEEGSLHPDLKLAGVTLLPR